MANRRLSSFTVDEFASEFLLCRVYWMCAGEYTMNINPATEGKASYVNVDETNELPPPYSRFPRRVADDTSTMATTYPPLFPPPSRVHDVYKRKKSARRASMVSLVVEKSAYLIAANPRAAPFRAEFASR